MWLNNPRNSPSPQKGNVPMPARPALLGNERGMALVMALILGLIGMLIITAVLYMIGTGTWVSGSKKRYQTALEASYGCMVFYVKEVIQRGLGGTLIGNMGSYNNLLQTVRIANGDFTTKLTQTGWIGDTSGYPTTDPDVIMTLTFPAPTPNMNVNATIVSTSRGNSGVSSNVLLGGGVVNNSSGTVTPKHIPYLFQVKVQGQSAVNSQESAQVSAIYAY